MSQFVKLTPSNPDDRDQYWVNSDLTVMLRGSPKSTRIERLTELSCRESPEEIARLTAAAAAPAITAQMVEVALGAYYGAPLSPDASAAAEVRRDMRSALEAALGAQPGVRA